MEKGLEGALWGALTVPTITDGSSLKMGVLVRQTPWASQTAQTTWFLTCPLLALVRGTQVAFGDASISCHWEGWVGGFKSLCMPGENACHVGHVAHRVRNGNDSVVEWDRHPCKD